MYGLSATVVHTTAAPQTGPQELLPAVLPARRTGPPHMDATPEPQQAARKPGVASDAEMAAFLVTTFDVL